MGYEHDMEEYHESKLLENDESDTYKIVYNVQNGTYYANSIWGLVWEVYSHRLWHLFRHGRWMD